MLKTLIGTLQNFRQALYQVFQKRNDASFELVDSLSSNALAVRCPVELSLNPLYRRNYCSITRSVDEFYPNSSPEARQAKNQEVTTLLAAQCPPPINRSFYLFAVDCTPVERVFSPTLSDRSPVYSPRPTVPSNKPVTIGHQYSLLACLPEKSSSDTPPWVIPLSAERVGTHQSGTNIGMKQISRLLNTQEKLKDKLCVSVADSAYSTPECLVEASTNEHLVHIARLRNNRSLPRAIEEKKNEPRKRGRPKQYGNPIRLRDKRTWGKPIETVILNTTSKRGKPQIIKIEGWNKITMRGKQKIEPYRLIHIQVYKENGELLFKRPLWVVVAGKRQDELTLQDIFESFRQRFDIEHFFRFGKMRLLADKFQTPETEHEEAWWQFIMMSYTQLYLARELAHNLPNPWEKNLPEFKSSREEKAPTQVQKDFGRIISEIGTPATAPKPRNKSRGRSLGAMQVKRQRHKVVYKVKKRRFQSSA